MLIIFSTFIFAAENDTIDSSVNITGNIPTSSIFVDEVGQSPKQGPTDGFMQLLPNDTIRVACWGNATDLDGQADLNTLEARLYSTSSSSYLGAENNSVHYRNTSCDITNLEITGDWNCTFSVAYYARNATWDCTINLTDDGNVYNDTITAQTEIYDLIAIDVENTSIDFGTKAVGTESLTDEMILVYNEGNVEIDLQLDAWEVNATPGDEHNSGFAFNCSTYYGYKSQIPIDHLAINLLSGEAFGDSLSLVGLGSTATVQLNLSNRDGDGSQTILSPTSANTYWGIKIPQNVAGQCTGKIRYIAKLSN